jgi:hypothetical protein
MVVKLLARVLALALVTLLPLAVSGAQTTLPDVDVVMVLEVADPTAWTTLHQEFLGTPEQANKPLRAVLPAGTGGNRSITIDQPKFTVSITTGQGRRVVRVGVTGRVQGAEALASLTGFELAAVEIQAGAIPNDLTLLYGLSTVSGQLLELYFGRS